MEALALNFGKVGGVVKGIGIGIMAVISLAAAIIFGKYCSNYSTVQKYQLKNPVNYNGDIYNCAIATTIFASISAAACILTIGLVLILSGMIGSLASAVPILFGICSIICEGLFYDFYLKQYALSLQRAHEDTEYSNDYYLYNNIYRNSSSAKKYIKKAIEAFYEQALTNLKAKYTSDAQKAILDTILPWETVSEKLGKSFLLTGSTTKKQYFEYPKLWRSGAWYETLTPLNLQDDKRYLRFGIKTSTSKGKTYGEIMAYLSTPSILIDEIPVATTAVTSERKIKGHKYKLSACWNTSDTKFKCKTFKKTTTDVTTSATYPYYISMHDSPFTLSQYIIADKLKSNTEIMKEGISADYLVSGFPIAYNLITNDDTKNEDYPWTFENLKKHFRVSPKAYAKAKANADNTYNTEMESGQHILCYSKPDFIDLIPNAGSTSKITCKGGLTGYTVDQFNNLEDDDEYEPFHGAFDYTHIGSYPGFAKRYWKSEAKDLIISYDRINYPQFAFAAFIITIVAIVFLAIGSATGFLPGTD